MKVSPSLPFKLIYSLFEHEYLGYLFESFVVQLDANGKLTYHNQNISSQNAQEFASGLDANDFELIKYMDSMQQENVVSHFHKKKIKVNEFFLKVYDKEKGDKLLQQEIERYIERRRSKIMQLMPGKDLFEMGNDGEPTWKPLKIEEERATVLFHFRKNEENTHYFPTIKHKGEKMDFQYKGAYIISNDPAWMVINDQAISFTKGVDGNKLKPFLNKKFIAVPKSIEETYYQKFVTQIVESFDVYAQGFDIETVNLELTPVLTIQELAETQSTLFNGDIDHSQGKMLLVMGFEYGDYHFPAEKLKPVNVTMEREGDQYTFFRVNRKLQREQEFLKRIKETGLFTNGYKMTLPKSRAIDWITKHLPALQQEGLAVRQKSGKKKYFIGKSEIAVEVTENIDWFDINAVVKFGEYTYTFRQIRRYILKKQNEIPLPNGEIAIIPESWFTEYSQLFAFVEEDGDDHLILKKHHLALVQELDKGNLAHVSISAKLKKLQNFEEIDNYEIPKAFQGQLRPYQKSGYDWLRFLQSYRFGGCLADDMGLGKTVQTLAMLQSAVDENPGVANLLIMPTSLIYNWEMEAKKFTPSLRVLNYTGTDRKKVPKEFSNYDLVLTSYGITRIDIDVLEKYAFNYVILDESQAIKNPDSNIAQAVLRLNCINKLVLTGTPVENSTMDLWSQMNFLNPGLLGGQTSFKRDYLLPIEKKRCESTTAKLYSLIKPFILRRDKSQVARDLPEKVENVKFCNMSHEQEEIYESTKSAIRNKILEQIDEGGLGKSQIMLLQGLSQLRQIANHPRMTDPEYQGDSGKFEDISYSLLNALGKGHKILIFSQFVKHLKIVRNFLDDQKIKYTYLDGSTKDRQAEVEQFQNDEDYSIFLISLKAGGVGLNLTKADYVFILDPWWNPAAENQAIDRAHRIGQQNKVFTYKFITKNTVEEKILEMQKHKLKLARDLISTEESFMKSLTKEDIVSLLD